MRKYFWEKLISRDSNPGPLGAKRECYPLCNVPLPQIHRDLSKCTVGEIVVRDLLCPIMCRPKIGIVKFRKLGVSQQYFFISKMVQGYGNRSADIGLVMQAELQEGHSFSTWILQSPSFNWVRVDYEFEILKLEAGWLSAPSTTRVKQLFGQAVLLLKMTG